MRRCLDCGELTNNTRCQIHEAEHEAQRNRKGFKPMKKVDPFYATLKWKKLSIACRQRDGGCVLCGSRWNLLAHHIIERKKGGPDALSNLITMCTSCHNKLHRSAERGDPRMLENLQGLLLDRGISKASIAKIEEEKAAATAKKEEEEVNEQKS